MNVVGDVKGKSRLYNYFKQLFKDISRDKFLYLLLSFGIVFLIIFKYIPMYGLTISFKDYNMFNPENSPWVGFKHFKNLFSTSSFPRVLKNTLKISVLKLLFGFPAPILLALLLNEFRHLKYKKFTQTVLYLPYFVSWVILSGIIQNFLNPTTGIIANFLSVFNNGQSVDVLTNPSLFIPMLIITELYKTMGWGTIIYFAAISGIDDQLYEAAVIDGAGKIKQAIYITLPSIRPTIVIVFILSLGNILNAGFDQIFMLYNPLVYDVADVIDTYVYRKGIVEANYSFSAAAGFFKSFVALVLILITNYAVKFIGEEGIW